MAQTPKPHLTMCWLQHDEHLIKLRCCSMTRREKIFIVITIQTVAIQVLLADLSTRGNDVGSADNDDVQEAHDMIVEIIELDLMPDE